MDYQNKYYDNKLRVHKNWFMNELHMFSRNNVAKLDSDIKNSPRNDYITFTLIDFSTKLTAERGPLTQFMRGKWIIQGNWQIRNTDINYLTLPLQGFLHEKLACLHECEIPRHNLSRPIQPVVPKFRHRPWKRTQNNHSIIFKTSDKVVVTFLKRQNWPHWHSKNRKPNLAFL